ncbi:hypothetical protein D6D02_03123 [Aureobasidium pullulans]|uniref:Uncharacterized protein n=2 Tax=Aureobasidium pullulans TaxID=5580 RepID=A0A4S9ZFG1_AURPU|nr:hypothetical protein D6D10_00638 [Aureobasidium pullulans]THY17551.1 hypothetical protein D6D02_03123 [Aureobasidium pullulans]TIA04913.1 hypothetical protein D6C82_00583 [Aureobasidium pullulans]
MIQPSCSNLLQTLTLGCMLGLTGYFGGISADYKVYRAPNCDGKISSDRSTCTEGIYTLLAFLARMSAASCVTQLDHQTCRGSSIGRACGSYLLYKHNLKVAGSSPAFGYSYQHAVNFFLHYLVRG